MDKRDYFLIILAFLGWSWGVIQFIVNRRLSNKDRKVERKYEAYSAYMKKADELMNNLRNDPNMIYGIYSDFMKIVLDGEEEEINQALIKFNEQLLDFAKKASEPLMIIKQELNSLLIICSDELAIKIKELGSLTTDFNDEMQKALSMISPNDSNEMNRQLQTIGQNERWRRFETLNEEIIKLMRKEINA